MPIASWSRSYCCYNPGNLPLQTIRTISRAKPFDFKYADGEEIIVYPSDGNKLPHRRHAIVITVFEQQVVRDRIRDAGTVAIGASRDKPADGSLGELLKQHGSSPQILSYLSAILIKSGILFGYVAGRGARVPTGGAGVKLTAYQRRHPCSLRSNKWKSKRRASWCAAELTMPLHTPDRKGTFWRPQVQIQ